MQIKNEREKLKEIRDDPFSIQKYTNPSLEMQRMAVHSNIMAFQYIQNPDAEIQRYVLENMRQIMRSMLLAYLKKINDEIKADFFSKHPDIIKQMPQFDDKLIGKILERNINAVSYFPSIDISTQIALVQKNPEYIKMIPCPSIQAKLEAVKKDGMVLRYIDRQSEDIQKEAIKQNAKAFQFSENQGFRMKIFASKQEQLQENQEKPIAKMSRGEMAERMFGDVVEKDSKQYDDFEL